MSIRGTFLGVALKLDRFKSVADAFMDARSVIIFVF